MDDGADLVSSLLFMSLGKEGQLEPSLAAWAKGQSASEKKSLLDGIVGGTEETTTGVIRLEAMEKDGVLKFPVIAVNDAETKHFFDNRYGTGQSTIDGIIRATNLLVAGPERRRRRLRLVRQGRRDAGRGPRRERHRHRGQPDSRRSRPRWTASASCRWPRPPKVGDIFVTVTGNKSVIADEHFAVMKDGRRHLQLRPLQRRDRHPGAREALRRRGG